jgi:hypothetical protein
VKHRLLASLFIGASLVGTPLVAAADPKPVAAQVAPTDKPKLATPDETAGYAEREQQAPAAAEFDGGARGIYIGGGALTLLLVVLIIVLLV